MILTILRHVLFHCDYKEHKSISLRLRLKRKLSRTNIESIPFAFPCCFSLTIIFLILSLSLAQVNRFCFCCCFCLVSEMMKIGSKSSSIIFPTRFPGDQSLITVKDMLPASLFPTHTHIHSFVIVFVCYNAMHLHNKKRYIHSFIG